MAEEVKNPFEAGPYIQLAAFCERVLHENDGVLSLIRVVDVVTHTGYGPEAPDVMPQFNYPLTLVLSLKSGKARGRNQISITPEQPSGEALETVSLSVLMEGEGKGQNIISRMDIPFSQEGLHWFTVRFNGELLTRMPLEVRYSKMVTGRTS